MAAEGVSGMHPSTIRSGCRHQWLPLRYQCDYRPPLPPRVDRQLEPVMGEHYSDLNWSAVSDGRRVAGNVVSEHRCENSSNGISLLERIDSLFTLDGPDPWLNVNTRAP